MKFSIKDFFRKCHQIRSFLRIWLHLLKKSLMENFIFCAVNMPEYEFALTRIFPYKNRVSEFVLTWENSDHRKPVFWNILLSDIDFAQWFSDCFSK